MYIPLLMQAGQEEIRMKKTVISTENAPAAIGAYSQAVRSGGLIYCSGQIPLDPVTMELVGDDVAGQTRRVMENLGAVLREGGSDFEHVLKCTIYLIDMAEFPRVNEVYGRYFRSALPARETVAVRALPKGARVEIGCIAIVPGE